MAPLELFCPAKLNLFLAVTGKRPDGFHDLVSLAAPLEFGDTLTFEASTGPDFSLACDDPAVPRDSSNLVLRAAQAFRAASGWTGSARFVLTKRIPMGAGLGGGSSDAAMALVGLNRLAGSPLSGSKLAEVAAEVGSDCPMFLLGGPVVMRGRGEQVDAAPDRVAAALQGRRVLVFKPAFGISTPWAYAALAKGAPGSYLPKGKAEESLEDALAGMRAGDEPGPGWFNSLERPAFAKFTALPVLLARLQRRFGLAPRMSGSGSACFALLPENAPVDEIVALVRDAWGASSFVILTKLL
ncbi:MAG: 4-diphosphocytidyl-2C-methyl-D-erythritol kinase [Verrucomicrobia bacterium]|nr:4-diphosphocytidyl-2C-methyl-D-erythritol kinase [Verrucomicrobiota bacterium]